MDEGLSGNCSFPKERENLGGSVSIAQQFCCSWGCFFLDCLLVPLFSLAVLLLQDKTSGARCRWQFFSPAHSSMVILQVASWNMCFPSPFCFSLALHQGKICRWVWCAEIRVQPGGSIHSPHCIGWGRGCWKPCLGQKHGLSMFREIPAAGRSYVWWMSLITLRLLQRQAPNCFSVW